MQTGKEKNKSMQEVKIMTNKITIINNRKFEIGARVQIDGIDVEVTNVHLQDQTVFFIGIDKNGKLMKASKETTAVRTFDQIALMTCLDAIN